MKVNGLSVIIPTFDRPKLTVRAIESVQSQGIDCEILVVDDGSPEPFSLPAGMDARATRIIRSSTNLGPSAARNAGIRESSGQFVTFLDSDDVMLPGTLLPRIDFAQSKAGLDTAPLHVAGCGWIDVDDASSRKNGQRIPRPAIDGDSFFGGCWIAPGSCVIFNRNVFTDAVGFFDEGLRRLEDVDWFIRFARVGGHYYPQSLLGSAIARNPQKDAQAIRDSAMHLLEKHAPELSPPQLARLKAYLLLEEANVLRRQGRDVACLVTLAKSWWTCPRTSLHLVPGWE